MSMQPQSSASRLRASAAWILLAGFLSAHISAAAARSQTASAQRARARKEYALGTAAYNHGDWPAALSHLRRAAKLGNTNALVTLGDGYAYEQFGNANTRPFAIILYRAAAERANPDGMERLGIAYLAGSYGVHQDYPKAQLWLRRAAAKGESDAMVDLGNMYCMGNGVPENRHTAYLWYGRAARAGNSDAREWWRERARDTYPGNVPPAAGMFSGPCMTRPLETLGTMGGHILHLPDRR